MSRRLVRRFWLQIHLWLGLLVGLLFVLLGLTGSLLCFYQEIDLALNAPARPVAAVGAGYRWQAVEDALRAAYPHYDGPWRIEVPLAPGRPINARYYRPPERPGPNFTPRMVSLDPGTLEILTDRYWGEYAVTWLYDLHYALLLGNTGRLLLAWGGGLMLVSLLSGLWLWWPAGRWRERLALRLRPGKVRATYDLHVLTGVYGLPLLLMLAVTGVIMESPDTFKPLIRQLGPLSQFPKVEAPEFDRPLLDEALAVAQARFPDGQLRWLETPSRHAGYARINLWQPGEPGHRFPKTNVWVAAGGEVLVERDGRADSAGDTFMAWLHPLHNGEVFGMTGRILVAVSGLLPLVLWVAGFLRWQHKRTARARSHHAD